MTDIKEMSYDTYRKHMTTLSHKKQRLNKIMLDKTDAHRTYREAFKKWQDLSKEQDKLTAEIIELLPNAF